MLCGWLAGGASVRVSDCGLVVLMVVGEGVLWAVGVKVCGVQILLMGVRWVAFKGCSAG